MYQTKEIVKCLRNQQFKSKEKVPSHFDVWLPSYESWICGTQNSHDNLNIDKNS